MTTAMISCPVDQIGETAGLIWKALGENGPVPISKLAKRVNAPRDQVMQAIGWLAREDKIEIEEKNRSKIISLR